MISNIGASNFIVIIPFKALQLCRVSGTAAGGRESCIRSAGLNKSMVT